MIENRASGVLLHITSLPSKYGIGDLGPQAYKFADLLAQAKQRYWQVLPLAAPVPKNSFSPYNSLSAFAGNTLLISPDLLFCQGLLTKKDIQEPPAFPQARVDYQLVYSYKKKLLNTAFEHFKAMPELCSAKLRKVEQSDYELFCWKNKSWLDDYAMFIALRQHFRTGLWCNWPVNFRDRNKDALNCIKPRLQNAMDKEKFLQYLFFKQWSALKTYCNDLGIQIIGDIPIYVAYESADVWAHSEIFKLTKTKKLRVVAGVPPDLFSKTGQLWGNPIYDWQVLKRTNYAWWIGRIKHNLFLFDIIRLDHFRGFIAYWQIPADSKTAKDGKWVNGPKENFFNPLCKRFPSLPIIVEDLGYITPDVRELIHKFNFTSMRVLLLAFNDDSPANPHYPHNHIKNCVVYTGTHDNNTTMGWLAKEAKRAQRRRFFDYVGRKVSASQVHWEFVRLAMSSPANTAIIPVQDILGLDEQARMNRPATVKGNWSWRLHPGQITPKIIHKLAKLTEIYGRA